MAEDMIIKNIDAMIVEDDPNLANILKVKFSAQGWVAEIAKDGLEALNMLNKYRPKLILLDLLLPKKNGMEFLEMARANHKLDGVPVLIVSNLYERQNEERLKNLGASEYIAKAQVSIQDLITKAKGYLKNEE